MPGKSPRGPEIKTKAPEKKKKVAPKVELEETPEKEWEKFGKRALKAERRAASFGTRVGEIDAVMPEQQPAPKEEAPLGNQDLETMTTRVMGMREGLELRREALGGAGSLTDDPHDPIAQKDLSAWKGETPPTTEKVHTDDPHDPVAPGDIHKWTGEKPPAEEKVLSVEDQMKEHGVFETTAEKKGAPTWQERAIEAAGEMYEKIIKDGASFPNIERYAALLRDELITGAKAGDNKKVMSYVRSFELLNDRVKEFNKEQAAKKEENLKTGSDAVEKELAPELDNNKTPETAPKTADAQAEEIEALLAAHSPKLKSKTPEAAPIVPRTPEQIEAELNASLDAARNELIEADKARKEERKQRGLVGRTWDKFTGNTPEASDSYKLARAKYDAAKLGMGRLKLGMDDYGQVTPEGQEASIIFALDEAEKYGQLKSLSPEKKSFIMRALQNYARMPAPARIGISLALSTVAVTGAIAATGGFAGLTAAFTFAGGRAARTVAGIALSTAATEKVGSLRNKNINEKQTKEKEGLKTDLSEGNMAAAFARVETMRAERKKYDRGTAVVKAFTAAVVGGTTGAALTEIASQLDTATAVAPDVFKSGAPAWNSQGYSPTAPNLAGAPAGTVENANLNPLVQSYDDPMHTPPYPAGESTLIPPAQGFGEEPIPPAQDFGDTVPAPKGEPIAPVNPPIAPAEAPALPSTDTSVTVKPGDNLWRLNERMLMQNKEFADLSPAKKQWVLSTLEKQGYEKLSQADLQSRGFARDITGKFNVNSIQAGAQLKLVDLNSPAGLQRAHWMIEEANKFTPADEQNILQTEAPAPAPTVGAPLNITPEITPKAPTTTASARSSVESVVGARGIESVAGQPVSPELLNSTKVFLAKGIMSADLSKEYSYWTTIKKIIPKFEDYQLINRELIAAQDTFKINLGDGKTVGKVLEELAQKRLAGGKILAA